MGPTVPFFYRLFRSVQVCHQVWRRCKSYFVFEARYIVSPATHILAIQVGLQKFYHKTKKSVGRRENVRMQFA